MRSARRRARGPGESIELLARLGREYRHFQQEHDREGVEGATRRTLEAKMERLAERLGMLLSRWVPEEDLREEWTRYVHKGGPPPDRPRIATPPELKGITDAGSRVEVRASEDGGYDVIVDGSVESHESVPWHLDPDVIEPIRVGQHTCREITDSPPEAVRALAVFLATPGAEPPWRWARALFEDGLIDDNFGLTPRGHRRLGKSAPRPLGEPPMITFGILAADAARARIFVLHAIDGEIAPTLAPLVEVAQTTHPAERARDSELFADTRPGLRREGPHGPRHGVSDSRERHRRTAERQFAAHIVEEAVRIWRAHGATRVLLVASPAMLGALRTAMGRKKNAQRPWSVRELARDLTRLAPPALHDVLAAGAFLPPRGRLPSRLPSPGLPT